MCSSGGFAISLTKVDRHINSIAKVGMYKYKWKERDAILNKIEWKRYKEFKGNEPLLGEGGYITQDV